MAEGNKIGFEKLDKIKKKYFILNKLEEDRDQTWIYNIRRQVHWIKGRHNSFKKLNFYISEIAMEVKIPRERIGITKDGWDNEIFYWDDSIKTWELWIQRLVTPPWIFLELDSLVVPRHKMDIWW